ncbi:hypothetical protein MNV49_001928 [Pseudohyphozyma bogoriensis]|nr:hypothetical protein MNV49_001928 [Pseudohyphozyma bogoriensis]
MLYPERARFDKAAVFSIFKAAPVVHVAFMSDDGLPRIEEKPDGEVFAYLHGAAAGRFFKTNEDSRSLCLTATCIDGLVFAATPMRHSAQYRTVMLHGVSFPFDPSYDNDVEAEKVNALKLMTNTISCEGRWENTRLPPTKPEMTATGIIRVRVEGASAKIHQPQEITLDNMDSVPEVLDRVWTGIIPLRMVPQDPIASKYNKAPMPEHIANFAENWKERSYGGPAPVGKEASFGN